MEAKIILAACAFVIALIYIEIGIYAFLTTKPMNFWSWIKVDPKNVKDLKKYNHANGRMWIFIGIPYLIFAGLAFCLDTLTVGISLGIYTVLMCFILIFVYKKIEEKYCIKKY